jgi:hypothetical protein
LNVRPFDLMATVSTGPDRVRRGDEAGSVWSSARLALSSCSHKFNLKAPTGRCQLRCSRNGVLSNGRLAADETAVDPRGLRSSNTRAIVFASSHAFSRRRGTRVASPRVADLPRREDRRCQYPGVRTTRPSVLCEALGAPSSCTLRYVPVVPTGTLETLVPAPAKRPGPTDNSPAVEAILAGLSSRRHLRPRHRHRCGRLVSWH